MSFEFEDVVCKVDAVTLVAPEHSRYSRVGRRVLNRLAASGRRFTTLNPGFAAQRLGRHYDLFIAAMFHPSDLFALNAVPDWRDSCDRAICIMQEIWLDDVERYAPLLSALDDFDEVFLEYDNSVDAVQRLIRARCHFLPSGIDTERFHPGIPAPPRFIDVYNVGRRAEDTHGALFEAMERGELFYYSTTIRPDVLRDAHEHRVLVANLLKRSRYAIAYPAKFNEPCGHQQEIGFRYFEGAAAGAVLLGFAPATRAFADNFDWPDAVVEIGPAGVLETIRALDDDPARLARIRTDNVVNCLRRHDCVHRFETMLASVGVDPMPAVAARKQRLERLADITVSAAR